MTHIDLHKLVDYTVEILQPDNNPKLLEKFLKIFIEHDKVRNHMQTLFNVHECTNTSNNLILDECITFCCKESF